MTVWSPVRSPFRFFLLVVPLVGMAMSIWLWDLIGERVARVDYDPGVFLLGLGLFLTLVLVGMSLYLTWCAFTIRYTLDGNNLAIKCGGVKHIVPLSSVTQVYAPGEPVGGKRVEIRWRGATEMVPGYVVGAGRSQQLGNVMSVATTPVTGQVFVVTKGATFGISPREPQKFVERIDKIRQMVSAAPDAAARTELWGPSAWGAGLWSDRAARLLLLLGLGLCTALFGYVSLVYSDLPALLPLHWNAQAQVDRIGDPIELVRLPVFALAVWLFNALAGWWVMSRERAATVFLLAGAVAAQVVFAAGAMSIVLRAG
jgi:hypothetical protein